MKKNFTLVLSAFILSCTANAQDYNAIIGSHLTKTTQNTTDFQITQNVFNEKTNGNQLHIQRVYQGIPIYTAYATYLVKNNQVQWAAQSEIFDANLGSIETTPQLSFEQAAQKLAQTEGLNLYQAKSTDTNTTKQGIYTFTDQAPQINYYIDENKQAYLAYVFLVKINKDEHFDLYDVVVDAKTGTVLEKHNQTLSCGFNHDSFANESLDTFNKSEWAWLYDAEDATNENPSYNVFKLPVEAPTFGDRTIYNQGAFNTTASPNGWHNFDGTENTITRGNNTRTVHDHESIGYQTYSGGNATTTDYVDGGVNRNFDFPVDRNTHPYNYKEASATNLFYMSNVMHDIFYRYGFTEEFGNFQADNYGKGGTGNDPVISLAQTGFALGATDNATFSTPSDGGHPRMAMYLWSPPTTFAGKPLTINSPSGISGDYEALEGAFSAPLPTTPLTRDLVLVRKNETTGTPYDACGTISNPSEVNGKIAVVLRGDCSFVEKVQNAQDAGAEGVIVVNNVAGSISMGGESTTITIPAISVTNTIGNPIVSNLESNTVVNGTIKFIDIPYIDGSFDNGIVAHEYGHGISTRLTGPRTNSACLSNTEQMGEGWSDFFGLMITQLPTDTATKNRGIGTFAVNQATTGRGIRPTPYTTNMSVNPVTYANVASYGNNDSPHRTGYVWATMLWDLNWKMIENYGFTPDLLNGNAGNTKALDLVMEGLRLQPCRPGFVDGRDAILAADVALNEGANQCDIWSVFARRGLGYSADQGSSNSRIDGTAAFDMPPAEVLNCELKTTDIKDESFKLFPNPAKDIVHFYDDSLTGKIKVEIVDMVGRVVSSENVELQNNRNSINTANLPKGVYVLKFHTSNGTVSKKLIKN
ncbi:T9SS-dependent M36 family metallopeptidase [Faecalibacter bovis]|uniref:T9SS-dependent M36 family metallopeptidase n=1 Tax=Faecalibacter bovis TaxID=2898187 RepID=A0ABX7XD98_9FLAO|nr:T9SS-dependent M36 family metallopeptidase [Faecalibacter bovis]QTV05855.1 T9SS-dependent M36 family metallopeptidase [Faecalibacter bovis]